MRTPRLSDERGIALAVAIFALVVIGALVAGTFFAGRLEQQSGRNTIYAAQAAEAADAGLSDAIDQAMGATYDALAIGATDSLDPLSLGGHVAAERRVTRLTSSLFFVRAEGSRTDAGGNQLATRALGTLVRMSQANITVNAGLTAIGQVVVNGTATVSGIDATPPLWAADTSVHCPPLGNKPGVIFNGDFRKQGAAVVAGTPDTVRDRSLNTSNILGGSTFNELKALATLTLTSGTISGSLGPQTTGTPPRCNTSIQTNWGAPSDKTSPCFNYFPVIYHYGNLTLSANGEGQGVLLVEGDLTAQGRVDFYGPVIVTGQVDVRGTGSSEVKFYGGILAQNVALDDNQITGNATVNYSSCAIQRALKGSATITPLAERSWAQLY